MSRLSYYRRILSAYVGGHHSQLTFWHGTPEVNERAPTDRLGEYYMPFGYKAAYPGPFDDASVPKLDYRGAVGLQYNPIAVAQYGLAHYNLYRQTGDDASRERFLAQSRWLRDNLETNLYGVPVWNHHFDWEYRETLKAPWYSALAQGQALSALVRAHAETEDASFLEAAQAGFRAFELPLNEGGVTFRDEDGYLWLEEAIVDPPTHILNGFLWAIWGLHDYHLHTGDSRAKHLFDESVRTLRDKLPLYDVGYWSLYELAGTRMKMMASAFYHSLHIVQLRVMHRLTGETLFVDWADRWDRYRQSKLNRNRSQAYKAVFKLLYY